MIKKYKKKPVTISAIKWDGSSDTYSEVLKFVGIENLDIKVGYTFHTRGVTDPVIEKIYIKTLEGNMEVSTGDYIIKGINGEFYPCKPDIFEKTYDEVI